MFQISLAVIFWLLLFLNNAEKFKLTENTFISRLRNQPHEQKASPPTTRQVHRCYTDCDAEFSFNDSLSLPSNCNGMETNYACEMIVFIDYTNRDLVFYSYIGEENLTVDNITYDSLAEHIAVLAYPTGLKEHIFYYACVTGDFCEWKYLEEIFSKLIVFDYQSLHDALLPRVYNSSDNPNITECYDGTQLINCFPAACQFHQSLDNDYKQTISRNCAGLPGIIVDISKGHYEPGPKRHDYEMIEFSCNINRCNSESNENEIKQIISSKGNEYITTIDANSLGTNLQLKSFYLFFLCLILINYLK